MNRNMNLSMNSQKVTVSLPQYLYRKLVKEIPSRQVSRFVAGAIEEKLLRPKAEKDPIESFLKLRKKLPKLKDKEIIGAIKKGRE